MSIRVALVEDDFRLLSDLVLLLEDAPSIEPVGWYTTGEAAIEGIVATGPDVALVDLGLPGISGIEVIRGVVNGESKTECVALTGLDDDGNLFAAFAAGAVGYMVKDETSRPQIMQAIQDVKNGEAPMSPGIARRMLQEFRKPSCHVERYQLHGLTTREIEILEYRVKGYSTQEVADRLGISYATVRQHQKALYKKLHVHSIGEAVAVYRGEKEV